MAPHVDMNSNTFEFTLVVIDDKGERDTDSVKVTIRSVNATSTYGSNSQE